jgi:hypothetical protein
MYKKTLTLILIGCFLTSAFQFFPVGNAVNYGIQTQIIDSNNDGTDCSIAVDSYGYPHIIYAGVGQGDLMYSWFNGSSWITQVIDNGARGSLKLDSDGNPHVCYFSYNTAGYAYLRYAYWTSSGWVAQTVDSNGGGRHASLALDSQGRPHISYYDDSSLKYASWNGNQWVFQVVDPGVLYSLSIGTFSSLQIDSSDHPHIAYDDETNGLVKYAYWTGAQWDIETIVDGNFKNAETSIVLDSVGNPHISYLFESNLYYAVRNETRWSIQTVDTSGDSYAFVGASCSLALDSKGTPHISYLDQYRGTVLKYAYLNGSSWAIYGLTEGAHGGYSASLAVDKNDNVHIVHGDYSYGNYSNPNKVMEYMQFKPADLGTPIVVPDPEPIVPPPPMTIPVGPAGTPMFLSYGNVGMYSSIALDSNGNPHVCSYDAGYGLMYAASNGSSWRVEALTSSYWSGFYTSIAIDSNGNPHISHCEVREASLRYAYWNGTEWCLQTADKGHGGSCTSIVLDSDGHPHISYSEGVYEDLWYAEWNGTNWQAQAVDSAGKVGQFTSIALDPTGKPCISYYDLGNCDLKFARWAGSNWNIQTVDAGGNVGFSTSMKIDSNGTVHISYLDNTNRCLKYAKSSGSGWSIQTVDSVGNYVNQNWFNQTSLALDANGYPHISYYNGLKNNLGYAYWNSSVWLIQTPDSSPNVGLCSSLALDQNGRAHISYYDSNGGLKYIESVNASGFPPSTVNSFPTSTPTPTQTPVPTATPAPSPSSTPKPTSTPKAQTNNQSSLSLTCKSENSFNVQTSGKLTSQDTAISNADIQLSYSTDHGLTWSSLATAKTNSTGQFTAQSTLPSAGTYLVRAFWTGNSTYSSASKVDNFVLAQADGQNTLSINSNSTISAYQFNSTGKAFSFNVNGPAGTSGYTSVYIPKSLISDVTGLKIYLDGEELPYTTDSDGDSWIVSFTYHHSSHKVDIQLPSLTVASGVDLPVFLIALLLLVPVIIAVGGLLVFYRRKTKEKLV